MPSHIWLHETRQNYCIFCIGKNKLNAVCIHSVNTRLGNRKVRNVVFRFSIIFAIFHWEHRKNLNDIWFCRGFVTRNIYSSYVDFLAEVPVLLIYGDIFQSISFLIAESIGAVFLLLCIVFVLAKCIGKVYCCFIIVLQYLYLYVNKIYI